MSRIPVQQNGRVSENLTYAARFMLARFNEAPDVGCAGFPKSLADLRMIVHCVLHLHFYRCLLAMMTSCQERFNKEYEYIPYWTLIDAARQSQT